MLFCFVLLESIDGNGGYGKTPNAFIFSLNNFEKLAPFVSKVKKTEKAIYRNLKYGPVFAQNLFIFLDAATVGHSTAVLGEHYPAPPLVKNKATVLTGHEGSFSPDEVEVFYLHPSC